MVWNIGGVRISSLSDVGGCGVAWRTSRYTLLDKRRFFLSEDTGELPEYHGMPLTGVFRYGVNCRINRRMKYSNIALRISTMQAPLPDEGAISVYQCRNNDSREPSCFICGDFANSSPGRQWHTTFGAFLLETVKSLSATEPTGQEGTYSNWASFGSQRIDYIYCRKADVGSYATINEDFDGNDLRITSSVHKSLLALRRLTELPVFMFLPGMMITMASSLISHHVLSVKATTIAQQCDTHMCATEGQFYIGNTRDEWNV